MYDPLRVDVAKIIQRERLEEAKSRRMFKRGTVSHPIELGKHIKTLYRHLLEQLQEAENRACQGEATADHGLP